MEPTPYPEINTLLNDLVDGMRRILGAQLVGVYLYGSLVTGDFDPTSSDVDLLAAIADDLDEQAFAALRHMHSDLADRYTEMEGRIEVQYLSVTALKTFKTQPHKIAAMSPGEPFHIIEGGKDWMINWYVVQEKGLTLFGSPAQSVIDHISQAEFLDVVRYHALWWRDRIRDFGKRPPAQAYAILTMCRALYTMQHGEQVSKRRAALWAQQYLPQWAPLIGNALRWRAAWRELTAEDETTFPETERFVHVVIDLIEGARG